MRQSKTTKKGGFVSPHPTTGIHCVTCENENQFDPKGRPPPKIL